MNSCKFCGKQIFWMNNNGKTQPFEDQFGTQKHTCQEFKQATKLLIQQVSELREQQQIDHNLIVKLISKFDEFTKKFSS